MSRPNPIRSIMEATLPSITYQRRQTFRPNENDVTHAYGIINRHVFNNELCIPSIELKTTQKAWGWCHWNYEKYDNGSWCHIRLMNKWYCPQWFMNTLAHEMVHQWQWDHHRWDLKDQGKEIYVGSGAHGPSFYAWREKFAFYGLNLKRAHRMKKWFTYQDFNKC